MPRKTLLQELTSKGIFHSYSSLELYDEAEGVFGDLIDSDRILKTLQHDSNIDINVGSPEVQSYEKLRSVSYTFPFQATSSRTTSTINEISIEVDNMSSCYLRIRWIDHEGHCPSSTHMWTIRPSSTFQQIAHPGHLFLITVMETIPGDDNEDLFDSHLIMHTSANSYNGIGEKEKILGAYRPKLLLPSRLPHNILVEGSYDSGLILEVLLLDDTKKDALTVASALLDEMHVVHPRKECEHTIHILQTIITNILDHQQDIKYRKLRLSNKSINRHIVKIWPAMDFLKAAGFQRTRNLPSVFLASSSDEEKRNQGVKQNNSHGESEEQKEEVSEEYLFLQFGGPTEERRINVLREAKQLLNILSTRLQDNFIADIAPPVPWQAPVLLSGVGANTTASQSRWGNRALHFVNDEERWHRAELNRQRRGRAGRRPNPGEAPSSRGAWGR